MHKYHITFWFGDTIHTATFEPPTLKWDFIRTLVREGFEFKTEGKEYWIMPGAIQRVEVVE